MELHYEKDEKVDAVMDISEGDFLVGKYNEVPVRVLAVVGQAVIMESPLSSVWSNKVYSAQQLYRMEMKKTLTTSN